MEAFDRPGTADSCIRLVLVDFFLDIQNALSSEDLGPELCMATTKRNEVYEEVSVPISTWEASISFYGLLQDAYIVRYSFLHETG